MPSSQNLQQHSHTLSHRANLSAFVSAAEFPCTGAKSALNKGRMRFAEYSALGIDQEAKDLCLRLRAFSEEFPDPGNTPVSFVAMFRDRVPDEKAFEAALWRHLQLMHDHDHVNFQWDASVGSHPASSDFSFSIGGRAFFVVGLHQTATRVSRRAPFPCLVFNFHNQFESLKSTGKYQSMQRTIRMRDIELQGTVNPVLARFGAASEARQYAGRSVDSGWQCPFHSRGTTHV